MLVVQAKLDAAAPHDADARAALRAAAEEPAAHDASRAARKSACSSSAAPCCATANALRADDGRVVRVAAADEDLIEVRCADADALARAAYHLGNRHTPVQVGAGWLRLAADDVLAGMLRGLGAAVTPVRAPFEPEAGAYAAGHHAHSSDAKHAGIIHDFAARDRDAR